MKTKLQLLGAGVVAGAVGMLLVILLFGETIGGHIMTFGAHLRSAATPVDVRTFGPEDRFAEAYTEALQQAVPAKAPANKRDGRP